MTVDVNKILEGIVQDIAMYVQFAVPEDKQEQALRFVEQYKADGFALRLLKEHYASLPDAIEEPIEALYELASDQGVKCILAITETAGFFYIVSADNVAYAGSRISDLSDEIISFIDRGDRDALMKNLQDFKTLPLYGTVQGASDTCPICGVGVGELHFLGCIVEVCPWCQGSLAKCNCRFEKMKIDEFESEDDLEAFEQMLDAEGRIPFAKEQMIAYPGTSAGLDTVKKDDEN